MHKNKHNIYTKHIHKNGLKTYTTKKHEHIHENIHKHMRKNIHTNKHSKYTQQICTKNKQMIPEHRPQTAFFGPREATMGGHEGETVS